MKRQKSCGPRLGKLVHQLPGVVTFAYDLRFRRVIARWKGNIEEIHFGGSIMPLNIIENLYLEKNSFRPSKWPRKWKPAKNSKLPKWPKNCFEPFGKGGWPPISTWINPPSLGINGHHCIKCLRERGKRLMNLHLGESFALCWAPKMSYKYHSLPYIFHLCFHYITHYSPPCHFIFPIVHH